jgi:hypothetical protein
MWGREVGGVDMLESVLVCRDELGKRRNGVGGGGVGALSRVDARVALVLAAGAVVIDLADDAVRRKRKVAVAVVTDAIAVVAGQKGRLLLWLWPRLMAEMERGKDNEH